MEWDVQLYIIKSFNEFGQWTYFWLGKWLRSSIDLTTRVEGRSNLWNYSIASIMHLKFHLEKIKTLAHQRDGNRNSDLDRHPYKRTTKKNVVVVFFSINDSINTKIERLNSKLLNWMMSFDVFTLVCVYSYPSTFTWKFQKKIEIRFICMKKHWKILITYHWNKDPIVIFS